MRRALPATVVAALALPATAWGHAALLRTVPAASAQIDTPPAELRLVYSEAVEPRFAIVSVTDADAAQQTSGRPRRSDTDPDELDVPLKRVRQGWYLVVWRVISVDGHPVRGVYTFAVGPNPGPQPRFVLPSLSETAATPRLVTARWVVFLSLLAAVGLFVLRIVVARPLRGPPRALTAAFWVALGIAVVATPVYALLATAQFAVRSFWSISALVPLLQTSAFGRSYLRLELVLLLFALAAGIALWLDRPDRPRRSVAELLALTGALLAAGAALLVPGAGGHAADTKPRALALALDWLHLTAGGLWVGGLIGLLVLWRSLPVARRLAGLALCVPRFSKLALGSVIALLGSGIWASVLHLPTLASLWNTSYGQSIIVKAALLLGAIAAASLNLVKTVPALRAPDPPLSAAVLLRRLVGGETLLVAAAVAVAAVLSSLPPPPKALAGIGHISAHVGPGGVRRVVDEHGYRLDVRVTPNRAAMPNEFAVTVTRNGAPVRGADVLATFTMLDMEMPNQTYKLAETAPGTYEHMTPALLMVGRWGVSFEVTPAHGTPFSILLVDRAGG